ncbi:hypothetical protein Pmani_014542 [Petrolisthes manimaculis]|uniref:Uncharacterized protein n=1 Tax=Petrolisthes manimaculis TaxID=1843537 RepID=A0AAE1PVA2_9EUCA|nr:hypothetical protein Pmani_014542 [Petrolisthes manimaculis]
MMTKQRMNVTTSPTTLEGGVDEEEGRGGGGGGGGGIEMGGGTYRAWSEEDEMAREMENRKRSTFTTTNISSYNTNTTSAGVVVVPDPPPHHPSPSDANSTTKGKKEEEDEEEDDDPLLIGLEEVPPWPHCLLLGFQHFLVFIGGTIAFPLALASFFCLTETDPAKGAIIATLIFVSGIITIVQTTLGVRLPIIQGCNFAYIVHTITILTTSFPTCDTLNLANMTAGERTEEWQVRMREIQGAIAVSAVFQVIVDLQVW